MDTRRLPSAVKLVNRAAEMALLGITSTVPSGASSLVWFRVISSTVPDTPLVSMKSPRAKVLEERITSPPATLPRMSSAASVTPREPTLSSATSEEELTPSRSITRMMMMT